MNIADLSQKIFILLLLRTIIMLNFKLLLCLFLSIFLNQVNVMFTFTNNSYNVLNC